jgi:hypothetical protein
MNTSVLCLRRREGKKWGGEKVAQVGVWYLSCLRGNIIYISENNIFLPEM